MSVYLDHAATSPILPEVAQAVHEAMLELGNPSSLHTCGRATRRRVEEAREDLAEALGARPSEVLFTSGGTESDNLAVKGLYRHVNASNPRRRRLVVSSAEHSAVLDSVEDLVAHEGAQVTWVDPGRDGVTRPEAFRAAVENTTLGGSDTVVAVLGMWANNETGVVQPVAEICALAREYDLPTFTDAVQAVGKVPVDFAASGATLLAATGHKIGGPVGAGILLAARDAPVRAISHGGGQERRLRSGTLAMPLIVGLAKAVRLAVDRRAEEAVRLAELRDRLIRGVLDTVEGARVTGVWEPGDAVGRAPTHAHVLIPGCEGDSLLFLLDAAGVSCSTGSACHAGVPQPSHVLLAMGYPEEEARGALRLTLGWSSTGEDVDVFLSALPEAVERAQRAHAATVARAVAREGAR
ncbi:cysteine desulfurase [Austwickia chelonae]|uniref:Cysteine desulfurase n=1 Tax=Austwickia chelonae NBRC 105200 TaxID=1184607 RepID=K6V3J9_9MICO|nr:cysteine desulfurase family protein [Austwickia chelonae]GAB76648.1 cysteine desulfurase [Austwickia chelonae NBRC 105200]SEW28668.1 cysteine desulfurase [Austwickia chelonae]